MTADPRAGGDRPPAARRFVALPVPPDVRETLAAELPSDPATRDGRRWTRPEGWHVTLAFLGSVPDAAVGDLEAALTRAVSEADAPWPRDLRVAGPGTFGRRVLWVGLEDDPSGSLDALAQTVRDALADTGQAVDAKPLRAHVTLARAGRRPITSALLEQCGHPPRVSWRPDAIELWRSELGRGPARYVSEAVVAR